MILLLVAGWREEVLALEVGCRAFRHLCGEERMTMERRGESSTSTSKRKRFARGGNRQIVASRKDPVIAPGAIQSAFLMFSFGDAASDSMRQCHFV